MGDMNKPLRNLTTSSTRSNLVYTSLDRCNQAEPKAYSQLNLFSQRFIDCIIFYEEMCESRGIPVRKTGLVVDEAANLPIALDERVAMLRERYATDLQRTLPVYIGEQLSNPKKVVNEVSNFLHKHGDMRSLAEYMNLLELPYPESRDITPTQGKKR